MTVSCNKEPTNNIQEKYAQIVTCLHGISKQENRWKRRMLPKWLLSIKGRTCNPTPLVHQDMTKKTTFL